MSTIHDTVQNQDTQFPAPHRAWYALFLIVVSYIFAYADRTIIGLIAPAIQEDFGISDTQMGLLQGLAFAFFYTVFGLPIGWAIDRYNRTRILTAGMTVWSVMTAACGISGNFVQMFAARVGVGIGESVLNPCASSLISDYFAPGSRPRAFAFYTMSTAIGSMLVYFVGGLILDYLDNLGSVNFPVIGELKPWQMTLLIVGLPGLIPALIFGLTTKEPKRLGRSVQSGSPVTLRDTLGFIASNCTSLGLLLIAVALVILEVYGAVYWHPTLFIRVHGWTASEVALYLGVPGSAFGVISAYTSASITNYFRKRGYSEAVWYTVFIGVVGCTVFGTIGPIMPTAEMAVVCLVTKSAFVNFAPAGALTAINESTPNEYRGFVTAVYIVLVGLFAQALGPLSVGASTDFVFTDPLDVGKSLALVVSSTGIAAGLIMLYAKTHYRHTVERATW